MYKAAHFYNSADDALTISGTSNHVSIPLTQRVGQITPFTVQITDSSTVVGKVQGLIFIDATDNADASALWQDITDGDFNDDCFISFNGVVTNIRVSVTSGTCKARILY